MLGQQVLNVPKKKPRPNSYFPATSAAATTQDRALSVPLTKRRSLRAGVGAVAPSSLRQLWLSRLAPLAPAALREYPRPARLAPAAAEPSGALTPSPRPRRAALAPPMPTVGGALKLGLFFSVWVASVFLPPALLWLALSHGYWSPLAGLAAWAALAAARPARSWPWMRELLCLDDTPYFDAQRIVFDGFASLPPDDGRVLAFHPHGLLCCGWTVANASRVMRAARVTWLVADVLLLFPGIAQFLRCCGSDAVSAPTMRRLLGARRNVALLPGGFEEATLFARGRERAFVRPRKGFIKLALQAGATVHPVCVRGRRRVGRAAMVWSPLLSTHGTARTALHAPPVSLGLGHPAGPGRCGSPGAPRYPPHCPLLLSLSPSAPLTSLTRKLRAAAAARRAATCSASRPRTGRSPGCCGCGCACAPTSCQPCAASARSAPRCCPTCRTAAPGWRWWWARRWRCRGWGRRPGRRWTSGTGPTSTPFGHCLTATGTRTEGPGAGRWRCSEKPLPFPPGGGRERGR